MNTYELKDNTDMYSATDKWRVSILFGVLFMLISSPFVYQIMAQFSSVLASPNGVPTIYGFIINVIIFTVAVRLLLI